MQSNPTAAHLPQPARSEQKIELVFDEQGGERLALRYSTWTEGLGWCCQKTIKLDGEQLEDLHRAITVARHRLGRQRAEAGQGAKPAQVIQLPTLS